MSKPTRRILPWILGVVLATLSLVGANYVLSRPGDGSQQPVTPTPTSVPLGPGVHCYGRVDVDSVIIKLFPLQPGDITEVLCYEGQAVKKGDILLRVNEELFLDKVAQADAAVGIAQAESLEARQALERYPEQITAQEAAVKAAEKKLSSEKVRVDHLEQLNKTLSQPAASAVEMKSYREGLAALEAALEGQQAKLRELQKARPDPKFQQAERNLARYRAILDEAKHQLEKCKLKAPSDGIVLRLLAGVGSQFSSMTQQPAVMFAPAGPRIVRVDVEQEFAGRVAVGQTAVIHDDATTGQSWQGKVVRIADAFLQSRDRATDILSVGSDTRPLECIVDLAPSQNPPRLGQRVRVYLGGAPR